MRPRTWFEQYTHNPTSAVEIITVEPGGRLSSSQYHHRRDEMWVVLDLGIEVEMGEKPLRPGEIRLELDGGTGPATDEHIWA